MSRRTDAQDGGSVRAASRAPCLTGSESEYGVPQLQEFGGASNPIS